jgi:predicted NBD/HSP70 family sugar kinase
VQTINEQLIYKLIENRQATSQVEIAQRLDLPSNTVHGIVNRLLKNEEIRVDRIERRGRGRPTQHYCVFKKTRVMAIQWLGSVWHAGVFLDNQVVGKIQKRISPLLKNCQEALQMLREFRDMTLQQAGLTNKDIDGTVLGINAVRVGNERILNSSVIPWIKEFSEEKLSKELECDIRLETYYSRSRTTSELRARAGENIHNLVIFNVGDGVSSQGLSLDPIWASQHSIWGEMGHIVVDPDGPICGCGHRGCLEALISGPAILSKVRSDVRNGVQTRLAEYTEVLPAEFFSQLEILERGGGDSYANTIVQELIRRCAWAISVVVNILHPDVIVMSGYVLEERPEWLNRILVTAKSLILYGENEMIRLEFPKAGAEDYLRDLAASFSSNQTDQKGVVENLSRN